MEYKLTEDGLEISNIENDEKILLEIRNVIFEDKPKNVIFNLYNFENLDSTIVAAFLSVIKYNQDSENKSSIIFMNPPKTIESKLAYVGLLDFGVVKRS